ncbi:MAG: RDD family protein, partial [Chloroflexota bacterium]
FASRFVAFSIDLAILVGFSAFVNWVVITAMGLVGIDLLAPLEEASANLVRSIMLIGKVALVILPLFQMGAYWFFFWNITGQTIGKRIMGVRVVRVDGGRMTTIYTVRRIIMYVLGMVPLFLGFLWILLDDERRGWHDKFAGTCVIYAWDAREVDHLPNITPRRLK